MKHKMWSRLLSMALAVMMIASIVPNSAFAEAASELAASSQVVTEMVEGTEEVTQPEETTGEEPAEQPAGEPASDEEPVAEPSTEPAVESEQPTAEPTQAPAETAVPSEQPSAEPSAAPEGTQTPEGTEAPEGTAVPSETPAASATPAPSESPVPSETPAPSEEPAIDGQALLDELMAIEDDEAFLKAVSELTEEQTAALEALGQEERMDYDARLNILKGEENKEKSPAGEYTAEVLDESGKQVAVVTVEADAGVVPEGAKLVADLLTGTDADTAADELDQAGVSYDGYLALDIRFVNGEGNEVEPNGEVRVVMVAPAALPEDADLDTVAVQHHVENVEDNTVTVEKVAVAVPSAAPVNSLSAEDITGLIADNGDVTATFDVNSFSTFTITWTVQGKDINKKIEFNLPVQLYSENGVALKDGLQMDIVENAGSGNTFNVTDLASQNKITTITLGDNEYTYEYAAAGLNGARIDSLGIGLISEVKTFHQTGDNYWVRGSLRRDGYYQTTYTYGVWYGENPSSTDAGNVLAVRSYTQTRDVTETYWAFQGWAFETWRGEPEFSEVSEQVDYTNLTLMYKKQSEGQVERELQREKYVKPNADGTYDLSLSVSGKVGSSQSKQPLDMLFIIDKSGSMKRKMTSDNNASRGERRIDEVAKAIKTITTGLESNEGLDVEYSAVTFSGTTDGGTYNDAQKLLNTADGWTDNVNTLLEKVITEDFWGNEHSPIYPDGGTNYEAGLRTGNTLLAGARGNALKVVIFLSDGDPTYYYSWDPQWEGKTTGHGSYYDPTAMEHAKSEAAKIEADYFYAIGVGPEDLIGRMETVSNAAIKVPQAQRGYKAAKDTDELKAIFDEIAGEITRLLCTNVTIEDTLSDNVEIVGKESAVKPEDFRVVVTKEVNGKEEIVAQGNGSVTLKDGAVISANYDGVNKKIILDFPDDYQLEAGYTYTVTAKIKATQTAYDRYQANGYQYTDIGETGTGDTSAGKGGMKTNDMAIVKYTYNGKEDQSLYPVPVIQLEPAELEIVKTFSGLSKEQINVMKNLIQFEVELNGEVQQIALSSFTQDTTDENVFRYKIQGIMPDVTYTIREKNAEYPDGSFVVETTQTGASGTTVRNGKHITNFTNSYTSSNGDLLISKTLTGINTTMGDDVTFIFEITGPTESANQKTYYRYLTFSKDDFKTAQDDGSVTKQVWLKDVPVGTYTVTELKAAGYTCNGNDTQSGVVTSSEVTSAQVEFTNEPVTDDPTPGDQDFVENRFNWNTETKQWEWKPAKSNDNEKTD